MNKYIYIYFRKYTWGNITVMKMSENNRQLLRKQVFNSSFEKKHDVSKRIIRTEKDPIYHCLGFWQNNI